MIDGLSSTAPPQSSVQELEKKKLREACNQFEACLNGYLIQSMRDSVLRTEEPEHAREMYESMMDRALAGELAEEGKLGVGELLYRQLEPLLERKNGGEPRPEEASKEVSIDTEA